MSKPPRYYGIILSCTNISGEIEIEILFPREIYQI
jgi:hypothetical protein